MQASIHLQGRDSQPDATVVRNTQREMACGVAEVRAPRMAPIELVRACKHRLDAIILCIQLSKMAQEEVARKLGIDKGHFTRMLQGRAYFPDTKSIALMRVCENYAPMQYEAMATGFELFQDAKAKREAELEAELISIRQQRIAA